MRYDDLAGQAQSYPGLNGQWRITLKRVKSILDSTLSELMIQSRGMTQGGSFLATLG
jgi:hypothetical protein